MLVPASLSFTSYPFLLVHYYPATRVFSLSFDDGIPVSFLGPMYWVFFCLLCPVLKPWHDCLLLNIYVSMETSPPLTMLFLFVISMVATDGTPTPLSHYAVLLSAWSWLLCKIALYLYMCLHMYVIVVCPLLSLQNISFVRALTLSVFFVASQNLEQGEVYNMMCLADTRGLVNTWVICRAY